MRRTRQQSQRYLGLPCDFFLRGFAGLLLPLILLLLNASSAAAQEAGRIVSIVGKAEVYRAGQWQPARLHQGLLPGDMVRPARGSRVAILLADESQIKVNANSTLELKEIPPPRGKPVSVAAGLLKTILNLFSGEIWVRSPGEPLEIRTPAATATIRGTELNLSIGPAVESRLAVLEGTVEFRNPKGSVLVKAGEQATARIGDAPRKTVLVNPIDAIQWSLYYPGIVSFRDYPLTDADPALLTQREAKLRQRVAPAPDDPKARIELGEVLFDLGKQTESRQQFERVLNIDPQSSRVHVGLGWVNLVEGKVEAALREFREARSRTRSALVGAANALYRLNRFEEAEQVIIEAKGRFPLSPQPRTQAAVLYIIQGRVSEARFELEQALALDPGHALAHGLLSNIYLVLNRKGLALEAAEQAVAANPFSPSAYLDLSLVRQAEFRLEGALQAAQKAVELDPDDPQALIQVSRILFGFGRLSEASEAAEQARRRAPQDSLVNSTLGFLLLAQGKVRDAIEAFDRAIQADSTRGEPHLGRGLALFRRAKTEEAVQEMWMATLLEPRVSLFHSYLGKALYDVKRDEVAMGQFAIAKKLDPRDPTPWFYDAIRKQSVNRPVAALHDLEKSVELNDYRAVYRSRFLLDEDLAARGATLGRIYDELGFQQRALVEGWTSLNVDPANYSAHRFLADSYSVLPRHEIARVSELLQSQLFQPINITPVQPQLAESKLLILEGAGPAEPSLNEFHPLFVRDRFALLASGIVGGNDTLGDEVVQSGVWGRLSYSLGQLHHETDGFRKNNDLAQDLYNAFVQVSLAHDTSIQGEFRYTDTEQGDRDLRFFPDDFFLNQRQEREIGLVRLGFHHAFSPRSDIIASVIYKDANESFKNRVPFSLPPLPLKLEIEVDLQLDEEGYLAEVQHLVRSKTLNVVSGIGHLTADRDEMRTTTVLGLPFSSPTIVEEESDIFHTNLYVYSQMNYFKNVTVTLGGSADFFRSPLVDRSQLNPKLGLTWNPLPGTTLRMAIFRALKRRLTSDQTIEPTQVAGFNQFFDDGEGTDAWRYGFGFDQKFSSDIYAGVEVSKRSLEVPFLKRTQTIAGTLEETLKVDWEEYLGRAYLYWTPYSWAAASAEYQFERFERDPEFEAGIEHIETHRFPFGINFFHPSGFSARLKATYVDQNGSFRPQLSAPGFFVSGSDQFWVVDAALEYRFPNRRGLFTVEAKNLFNEEFKFQDTDPANPLIQPERLILTRFTLFF